MINPFTARRQQRAEMDRLGRSVLADQYEKKSWSELRQFFEHVEGVDSAGKTGISSQIKEYRSWIFDIVNAIQRRVVTIPRRLYLEGKDAEIEIHPVVNLLKKPNQFLSGRFLMQFCQMSIDLTGKFWIYIVRDNLGFPYELWPLVPTAFLRFAKGSSNKDFLKGHWFKMDDGDEKLFKARDVLYQHYPHPEDLIDGMSPIQAQAYATDIDHYIEVYERRFFKNSARPDIIFEFPDGTDVSDRERFRDSWGEEHQGESRSHRSAFLPPGIKPHMDFVSARDFEFVNLAQWDKDKLCGAYSTPEMILGQFKDVNRASSFEAHRVWNETCIDPRLKLWEELITGLAQEWDPRLYFQYDSPVPEDEVFALKEATEKIGKGIWSPDEAREAEGKEPRGGMADELYMPSAMTPITLNEPIPKPAPEPEPEPDEPEGNEEIPDEGEGGESDEQEPTEEEGKCLSCGKEHLQTSTNAGEIDPELPQLIHRQSIDKTDESIDAVEILKDRYIGDDPERRAEYEKAKKEDYPVINFLLPEILETEDEQEEHWKRYIYRTKREEQNFRKAVVDFFDSQEDAMLGRLKVYWPRKMAEFNGWSVKKVKEAIKKRPAIINEILLNEDDQAKILQNHLRPHYNKIVEEHGAQQMEAFQVGVRFDVDNPDTQEWIAKHSLTACKTIQATHFDKLRWVLQNGITEGLSMDQIAQGIKAVYQSMTDEHSKLIARTEVIDASNQGLLESWDQINQMTGEMVVHGKEWLVSFDDRLCERCAPMNGAIIPLHGEFEEMFEGETITYQRPTLHPRCRCVLLAVTRPIVSQ